MKWLAAFAARLSSRKVSATPAYGQSLHLTSASTCSPASTAYPLPKPDGALPLPALRLALILESRRARDLRQSKLAAQLERDLQSVNHQMMAIYLGSAK